MESGDFAGARREFGAVIRAIPEHLGALNNYAVASCEKGGSLDQAVGAARKARALAPKNPYVADTLGFALLRSNRASEAVPLLREAAAALEKSAGVHFHLGLALARTGEKEEAWWLLRVVPRISPPYRLPTPVGRSNPFSRVSTRKARRRPELHDEHARHPGCG